jgi:hypothetical protein
VLIVYDRSVTDINIVLPKFSEIHPNLHYAIELEEGNKINYLDLTIHRKNDTLEFSIFRKPTYTDAIIPYNLCHHYECKYAALRYLINRLNVYQINPSARKEELIIIQNILYNNYFPLQLINNLLKKQK